MTKLSKSEVTQGAMMWIHANLNILKMDRQGRGNAVAG